MKIIEKNHFFFLTLIKVSKSAGEFKMQIEFN